MPYHIYILYSPSIDRYYIGSTSDLTDRLSRHNTGRSKSTKAGAPWKMVYSEVFDTRSQAMQRELAIKNKKSRTYIESLINSYNAPY